MEIYTLPAQENCIPDTPRAVALGLFDGLHIGHRQVVLAAAKGLPDEVFRCVYTFAPHSVTTKAFDGRLWDGTQQRQLLTAMGIDELFEVDFASVQQLSPAAFVEEVLHRQLRAVQVACGYNYRFGKGGAGDTALLTTLCEAYGIRVIVVPPVRVDGQPISSTAVRQALAAGDMATVRRFLGRSYCLRQPVVAGQHLGRRLGMPTINQQLPADLLPPRYGVYASCVEVEGQVLPAVTNIGRRPTVGSAAPLAETFILSYSGDLYGTVPAVYPLVYLRPEQTFSSLEELQEQMAADAATAAALFAPPEHPEIRAILLDFDDTLGCRDEAFLLGLTCFLQYYWPELPREELVRRREEMFYHNRAGYGGAHSYAGLVEHFLKLWDREDVPVATALRRLCDGFASNYPLHEDVIPTLQKLRQRGFLLALITNGSSYPQNRKMDYSALRPYFDLVMVCGDEEMQKPHPQAFLRTAARLGVPPCCCVMVGDHPQNDIQAALDAGLQAIRKDAAHQPGHPFYFLPLPDTPVIRQIGDLLELVAPST